MFDHLLESSQWEDSNKWSNIGFGQEIDVLEMKIRTLSGALIKWSLIEAVAVLVRLTPKIDINKSHKTNDRFNHNSKMFYHIN